MRAGQVKKCRFATTLGQPRCSDMTILLPSTARDSQYLTSRQVMGKRVVIALMTDLRPPRDNDKPSAAGYMSESLSVAATDACVTPNSPKVTSMTALKKRLICVAQGCAKEPQHGRGGQRMRARVLGSGMPVSGFGPSGS